MEEKKPTNLADNLSSARKYDANLGKIQTPGEKGMDFNKLKTKLESFKKKSNQKFPVHKSDRNPTSSFNSHV